MSTVRGLTEDALLRAWEEASTRSGVGRAVALAAAGHHDPDAVWDLPLGERDTLLLSLRERCFGPALACGVTCPACGEQLDVDLDAAELLDTAPAVGLGVRPLTSRDVVAAAAAPDPRAELVRRCAPDLPEGDDAAAALAGADPRADLGAQLTCAACGHGWRAAFDAAAHLWAELDTYARRLLHDVHCLATAYGWREPDVLALAPARRRYYLELVAR